MVSLELCMIVEIFRHTCCFSSAGFRFSRESCLESKIRRCNINGCYGYMNIFDHCMLLVLSATPMVSLQAGNVYSRADVAVGHEVTEQKEKRLPPRPRGVWSWCSTVINLTRRLCLLRASMPPPTHRVRSLSLPEYGTEAHAVVYILRINNRSTSRSAHGHSDTHMPPVHTDSAGQGRVLPGPVAPPPSE